MEQYSFEKLEVYQLTRKLIQNVYQIVNCLPANERFALGSQLQRAIVSVLSNIAEGSGRVSIKEKIHFVEISYGSLMEAYCQLQICCDLYYITEDTLKYLKPEFFRISRLLNALKNSYKSKLPEWFDFIERDTWYINLSWVGKAKISKKMDLLRW